MLLTIGLIALCLILLVIISGSLAWVIGVVLMGGLVMTFLALTWAP